MSSLSEEADHTKSMQKDAANAAAAAAAAGSSASKEVRSWRKKHMTLNLQRFHSSGGSGGSSMYSSTSSLFKKRKSAVNEQHNADNNALDNSTVIGRHESESPNINTCCSTGEKTHRRSHAKVNVGGGPLKHIFSEKLTSSKPTDAAANQTQQQPQQQYMSPAFFHSDLARAPITNPCLTLQSFESPGITGGGGDYVRDTPRSAKEDTLTISSGNGSRGDTGELYENTCEDESSGDEKCGKSSGVKSSRSRTTDAADKAAPVALCKKKTQSKKKEKELTRLQRTLLTTIYTDFVIRPMVSQDYGDELLDFLEHALDFMQPSRSNDKSPSSGVQVREEGSDSSSNERVCSARDRQVRFERDKGNDVDQSSVDGRHRGDAPFLTCSEFAETLLERKRTNHYTLVAFTTNAQTGRKTFISIGSVVLLTRLGLCNENEQFGLTAIVDSVLIRRSLEETQLPQKMIARLIEVAQMIPGVTNVMACLPHKHSISHDIIATATHICALGTLYRCSN